MCVHSCITVNTHSFVTQTVFSANWCCDSFKHDTPYVVWLETICSSGYVCKTNDEYYGTHANAYIAFDMHS